ncbi:dTDP-4-dehydrorhamnose 3,5-epimerase [Dysgonomonas sp. BGC7]|uniref:dTDP-4-dehydrorhamnose 3,5-epimerase n=1 Tax=Dysgonomonas sp. BGC7 TaxID=1658008 RepID=UPI000681D917|nr:dTDP-4-dehydrorhamnose 3,5-epimerase [Dysgonomonas sp. BGC7]MBD8388990.1 dTDP-4-dehydrorhamnose 3,5-epimerase [Dysgonomonas sp. BGC7]
MKFTEQEIKGVWIIEPKVFTDERGYFMESYKKDIFEEHIGRVNFIQDNESRSTKGVLRGLHYQTGSYSQAKLVRALKGRVLDVVVDLRKSSPSFGKHVTVELTEDNKKQLFVPRGFAHGFLVLSDEAIFSYKVDNVYSREHEATLLWNDPSVGVDWGVKESDLILSAKDKIGQILSEAVLFG